MNKEKRAQRARKKIRLASLHRARIQNIRANDRRMFAAKLAADAMRAKELEKQIKMRIEGAESADKAQAQIAENSAKEATDGR